LEFVYSPDHQLATLYPPPESKDSKPPHRPGSSSSSSRSTSPGEAVDDTLDSVCVFSEFDERRAVLVLKKDTTVDQIVDFVLAHSLPKVCTSKYLSSLASLVHVFCLFLTWVQCASVSVIYLCLFHNSGA